MACASPSRRIVILAHGSKDERWQRPFHELLIETQARLGVGRVRVAFMEFMEPTLADVAAEAASDRAQELLIVPFFLATGAHLAADIPAQVEEVRRRFPRLQIRLAPAIGEHPRVKALFRDIACEYADAPLTRSRYSVTN